MSKKQDQDPSDEAAAPSSPPSNPPVAASQPIGPKVKLSRYVGKDGVRLRQHEIYLEVEGKQLRVGYAGWPPTGGIALIRGVSPEERTAIEAAYEKLFKQKPSKTLSAPAIGDATEDDFEELYEDVLDYGDETGE